VLAASTGAGLASPHAPAQPGAETNETFDCGAALVPASAALFAPWAGGRHLKAVGGLSGGLVGTGDATGDPFGGLNGHTPKHFDYAADLFELPIYFGCHTRDLHVPLARVREGETVHAGSQADCRMAIHPGAGHAITAHDVSTLRRLLSDPGADIALLSRPPVEIIRQPIAPPF
jgi:hypothetical protein